MKSSTKMMPAPTPIHTPTLLPPPPPPLVIAPFPWCWDDRPSIVLSSNGVINSPSSMIGNSYS